MQEAIKGQYKGKPQLSKGVVRLLNFAFDDMEGVDCNW